MKNFSTEPITPPNLNKYLKPGKNTILVSRDLFHIARSIASDYNGDHLECLQINWYAKEIKAPLPFSDSDISVMPFITIELHPEYDSQTWDIT